MRHVDLVGAAATVAVFLVACGSGGAAITVDVEVSGSGVDQAIITTGLAAGERVTTSNLQYVTQGMPVRVAGDPVPVSDTPAETAAKDGDQ